MGYAIKKMGSSIKPIKIKNTSGGGKLLWGCNGPSIDYLAIIADVDDAAIASEMRQALLVLTKDTSVWLPSTKSGGGYSVARRLRLGSLDQLPKAVGKDSLPHLEWRWDANGVSRLRLSFNPTTIGAEGMLDLHNELQNICHEGWKYFIQHGKLTRADIKYDVAHWSMGDFYVIPTHAVSQISWNKSGRFTGVVFGGSKGRQLRVYDLKEKHGMNGVRLECKTLPNMPLIALPKMANPFAKYVVATACLPAPKALKSWEWSLLCHAATTIGMANAIKKLPTQYMRSLVKNHIASFPAPTWKANELWKGWKAAVINSKLVNPSAWY
ncbi:hypothetical protein [Sphingomicrobium marinum]|uniref:hypothetical protein n=1 Tax=Sphingomicrobium marinum TaxID=1227950 RepID=UPI00223EB9BA|nr:hypothetical protein [Sphingomicrobium marinum]